MLVDWNSNLEESRLMEENDRVLYRVAYLASCEVGDHVTISTISGYRQPNIGPWSGLH